MKTAERLKKSAFILYCWRKYKALTWTKLLTKQRLADQDKRFLRRNGNFVEFTQTGNKISVEDFYMYEKRLGPLLALLNHGNVRVDESNNSDGLLIKIGNTRIRINSASNVLAAYEIFILGLYDLFMPGDKNVVLDIGMNVGYASLFFASSAKFTQVYSFEPFPETYSEAVYNIDLNPKLKGKIQAFNYGISNKSETVSVPAFKSGALIASTTAFMLDSMQRNDSAKRIEIEVRDILEVMDEIKSSHAGQNLFLKIDCEGEEYAIIDRLNNNGRINDASGYLIEWHRKGSEPITSILSDNGFASIHLARPEEKCGMIYAFRSEIKNN